MILQNLDLIFVRYYDKFVSGLEICKMIRDQITVPICFITAKDMAEDLVAGINAKAPMIIQVKPLVCRSFSVRENAPTS